MDNQFYITKIIKKIKFFRNISIQKKECTTVTTNASKVSNWRT